MSDIQEIMDRDPLGYTKGIEIPAIIKHLRDARVRVQAGEKSAGSMKPKKEIKPINIDDLG